MHKKKILVIDDDEMNLQIAKMIIEKKLPCEVLCASSGFDGLKILRREHVNLVLLDIMMPEFDGIETLQEIRGDEQIQAVPIMMLTASGDIENIQKVGTLGVKEYIKKPFMPADLIKRVEKKLAEVDLPEVLLLGDDETALQAMKSLLEENFDYEVLTATTTAAAENILVERDIKLIIADANMKFIDGFKFLALAAEKFDATPFTLTTADKLLAVVEKINAAPIDEPAPVTDEISQPEKKRLANVVATLIGYELDVQI